MTKMKIILTLLLASFLLVACSNNTSQANLLNLEPYSDPAGIFEMTVPQGWMSSYDEASASVTFEDPLTRSSEYPLSLQVIAMPVEGETAEEISDETKAIFENFIATNVPENIYDVYSTGEMKVGKKPALIVDFAKQIEGGYVSGRIVLVVLPGVAVGFIGESERSVWDAFTPTFTQMLADFVFLP